MLNNIKLAIDNVKSIHARGLLPKVSDLGWSKELFEAVDQSNCFDIYHPDGFLDPWDQHIVAPKSEDPPFL